MRIPIDEALAAVFAEQGDSSLYRALGWTKVSGAVEVDLDAARAAAPAANVPIPALVVDGPVNYATRWLDAAHSRPERRVGAFQRRRS